MVDLAIGQRALCVLTNTYAPFGSGTISGTVVDSSGAGIEGAQVTITDEASSEAGVVNAAFLRTESTGTDGDYVFFGVPIWYVRADRHAIG